MHHQKSVILGIDLAWGRKMPDACVPLIMEGEDLIIGSPSYTHGDAALLETVDGYCTTDTQVLIALDAPTLCQNTTGSRPVDKECNQHFRKYEAGCHPVNLNLCARPLELAETLEGRGFLHTWKTEESRILMEVYPHPAMIRFFQLEKTIKYKRGTVAQKKSAFQEYQALFSEWLEKEWSPLPLPSTFTDALSEPWSKETEDILDAHLCAFIGLWHLKGKGSQVLGDDQTGFMVIPNPAPAHP